MRHNSSLVCTVGITYEFIDTIFEFYGYILFLFFLYPSLLLSWMLEQNCLDTCCLGCLSCMCFVFCICTCSAQLSMFHMERRSRNRLTIIISSGNPLTWIDRRYSLFSLLCFYAVSCEDIYMCHKFLASTHRSVLKRTSVTRKRE